jgi:hypothetical protein
MHAEECLQGWGKWRLMRAITLASAILVLCLGAIFGQERGGLRGAVLDTTGNVIAGALVEFRSAAGESL